MCGDVEIEIFCTLFNFAVNLKLLKNKKIKLVLTIISVSMTIVK